MKLRIFSVILLACASVSGLWAEELVSENAVVATETQSDVNWGGPVLGGGIKGNGELTEGSLFMLYPLLNSIGEGGTMAGSLFYLEPYGSWAESGDIGLSLGLGFRHLFSDQTTADALTVTNPGLLGEGVFVGANLFLDYGRSAYDSNFWQGGVGVEAGTRYLEVRGNYYVPFSDDRTLRRYTDVDVRRSTSSSTRTSLGSPTVSGGQVVQNVNRATTTTTRTTTTRTTHELFEEGLRGWDMEMALLVPGLDQYMEMRLIGGYYSFSGDRSKVDIDGFRAGVELRPIPALVLHGTWFESDRLYQGNWLAGVRVELPLERISDAFRVRRRHFAERLFEPVRRKISAITTNGAEQSWGSPSTTTTTSQSTQNQTSTRALGPVGGGGNPPMEYDEGPD